MRRPNYFLLFNAFGSMRSEIGISHVNKNSTKIKVGKHTLYKLAQWYCTAWHSIYNTSHSNAVPTLSQKRAPIDCSMALYKHHTAEADPQNQTLYIPLLAMHHVLHKCYDLRVHTKSKGGAASHLTTLTATIVGTRVTGGNRGFV